VVGGSRDSPSGSAAGFPRLRGVYPERARRVEQASLRMIAAKTPARFGVAKRFSGVTRCPVMADLIKQGELKERMKKIPEWELEKKHIERTFEFDDFADAIDFVNAVAEVAEEEEHHPDIDIRYNKVRLVLSTHSKGGLTELDFGLAERIDTLAE
jgi:4a-hydroxytetrahydrobiopterin dehydratase